MRACARKVEGAEGVEIKGKRGDGGGAEDGTREGGVRGEWEEALALEVVLTCTEMPSPCQVAGREEPRRRPHLPGRGDRVHDGQRCARPGSSEGRGGPGGAVNVVYVGDTADLPNGFPLSPKRPPGVSHHSEREEERKGGGKKSILHMAVPVVLRTGRKAGSHRGVAPTGEVSEAV